MKEDVEKADEDTLRGVKIYQRIDYVEN